MFAVQGFCTKCKETLDIISPGMVCFECEKYHHGHCMVPPQTLQMLENYVLTSKEWYCDVCGHKRRKTAEIERRSAKEMVDIRKKLDTILDVREILIMIEEALQQMTLQCDELMAEANEQRKDNEEMRIRLRLHEKHGNVSIDNLSDWRKQRKKLHIDNKPQVKGKNRKTTKKKFEKRERLRQLQKKHNFSSTGKKSKRSTRKSIANLKSPRSTKKSLFSVKSRTTMASWREKILYSIFQSLTALSKSWRIQLILLCVLIAYTIMGAAMFFIIEGQNEEQYKVKVIKERNKILEEMQKMRMYNTIVVFDQEGIKRTTSLMLDKYYEFLQNITQSYGNTNMIKHPSDTSWSFLRSVFFCTTTYTTIGYGDTVPVTTTGKIVTMVYASIGIPLFFALVASLGKTLVKVVKSGMHRITDLCPHLSMKGKGRRMALGVRTARKSIAQFGIAVQERMNIPLWPVLILQVIFITVGAAIFLNDFEWDFFISFYFIFITLTTIGFGDIVPSSLWLVFGASAYIIFGLTLTAVTIHATMEWMDKKLGRATQKLERGAEKYYDENYGEPSSTSINHHH